MDRSIFLAKVSKNKSIRANSSYSEICFWTNPGQKFRIGIHSEPIRTISIHSNICIRTNANYSESNRKKFCISFLWKPVKIQILNQNQSDSFRPLIHSDWFWLKIRFVSIGARIDSDCKLCSCWFRFIRIDALDWIRLSWIDFWPFFTNEIQNVLWIGSEWFALARIQISEWIEIVLIDSELISIRYFRQGYEKKFWILFDAYWLKIIPIQSELIRINLSSDWSEPNFQSKQIRRINIERDP